MPAWALARAAELEGIFEERRKHFLSSRAQIAEALLEAKADGVESAAELVEGYTLIENPGLIATKIRALSPLADQPHAPRCQAV